MQTPALVLRDDDERYPAMHDKGWTVTARSWGARLEITPQRHQVWREALARLSGGDTCRELQRADAGAALALDAATAGDYPGGLATAHEPLTAAGALPTAGRRGFGVFDAEANLVAMTFLDVRGHRAEVAFTVVARRRRGQGLATAVKAASLLALARDGVTMVRTGGSDENAGILAANSALGFEIDERWLTLTAPSPG